MKIIYFIAISFSFALASCRKDKAPVSYYVKYKVNGTEVKNTNSNQIWLRPNSTIPNTMELMFVSTTHDFKNSLGITIEKPGTSIAPGVYQYGNSSYQVIADYFQDLNGPNEKIFSVENAPGGPSCNFNITYTSITATEFKGTFNGNYFYKTAGAGPMELIYITDGEFCVRRY